MLTRHVRRPRRDGKIEALRRVPALAPLGSAELLRIAAVAELLDVAAGAVLTREGEAAREAFLVVEGDLRVVRSGLTITRLEPGDLAGDVALLDGQPRATGVEALTPAVVAVLSRAALQRLVHTSPAFTGHLLGQLAVRVRCGVPT